MKLLLKLTVIHTRALRVGRGGEGYSKMPIFFMGWILREREREGGGGCLWKRRV